MVVTGDWGCPPLVAWSSSKLIIKLDRVFAEATPNFNRACIFSCAVNTSLSVRSNFRFYHGQQEWTYCKVFQFFSSNFFYFFSFVNGDYYLRRVQRDTIFPRMFFSSFLIWRKVESSPRFSARRRINIHTIESVKLKLMSLDQQLI